MGLRMQCYSDNKYIPKLHKHHCLCGAPMQWRGLTTYYSVRSYNDNKDVCAAVTQLWKYPT